MTTKEKSGIRWQDAAIGLMVLFTGATAVKVFLSGRGGNNNGSSGRLPRNGSLPPIPYPELPQLPPMPPGANPYAPAAAAAPPFPPNGNGGPPTSPFGPAPDAPSLPRNTIRPSAMPMQHHQQQTDGYGNGMPPPTFPHRRPRMA